MANLTYRGVSMTSDKFPRVDTKKYSHAGMVSEEWKELKIVKLKNSNQDEQKVLVVIKNSESKNTCVGEYEVDTVLGTEQCVISFCMKYFTPFIQEPYPCIEGVSVDPVQMTDNSDLIWEAKEEETAFLNITPFKDKESVVLYLNGKRYKCFTKTAVLCIKGKATKIPHIHSPPPFLSSCDFLQFKPEKCEVVLTDSLQRTFVLWADAEDGRQCLLGYVESVKNACTLWIDGVKCKVIEDTWMNIDDNEEEEGPTPPVIQRGKEEIEDILTCLKAGGKHFANLARTYNGIRDKILTREELTQEEGEFKRYFEEFFIDPGISGFHDFVISFITYSATRHYDDVFVKIMSSSQNQHHASKRQRKLEED